MALKPPSGGGGSNVKPSPVSGVHPSIAHLLRLVSLLRLLAAASGAESGFTALAKGIRYSMIYSAKSVKAVVQRRKHQQRGICDD